MMREIVLVELEGSAYVPGGFFGVLVVEMVEVVLSYSWLHFSGGWWMAEGMSVQGEPDISGTGAM
ncbi:MAG: hypothetical protein STSR0009_29410 [Methanoregula sp.]